MEPLLEIKFLARILLTKLLNGHKTMWGRKRQYKIGCKDEEADVAGYLIKKKFFRTTLNHFPAEP